MAKLRRKTELGRQPARVGLNAKVAGMKARARICLLTTLMGVSPLLVAGQMNEPDTQPATIPTTIPTTEPTTSPTTEPSTNPTTLPTSQPTTIPTTAPTTGPTTSPTAATQPAVDIVPLAGIAEGSFFPEREGRLQRTKDGRKIQFVFEQDGKQMGVPILPNLELMRLENAVEESGWGLRFRASGWITEYLGKNYILLDHASRVNEKSEPDAPR
jgi:hypothetical protein